MIYPEPVHIIAEAGTNHNGSVANGKQLIDLSVRAKADTIKFQIIDPDKLYLPGNYVFGNYDINQVRANRKRFMLTDAQYAELAEYTQEKGAHFTASVFDQHGLDFLASLQPLFIKIASTDLNNVRLLRSVAEKGIRMLLSTGMSSLSDIEHSVIEILRTGFSDIVLMHCVSVYPANLEEMNLPFIDTLRSAFGFPVGFSDHTESSIASCIALTKGVCYIEKHFTYDKTAEGFDHAYASENDNFVNYVANIRAAESALRVAPLKINDRERYTRKRARRSLYAARDLKAGDVIQDIDVLIVRPENVMSADQVDIVVGRRLTSNLVAYAPFTPEILTK